MSSLSARRCATHGNPNGGVLRLEQLLARTPPTIQIGWLKPLSGTWRDWCHVPKRDSGIPRVVRRDHPPVFRSATQAVKHAVGCSRDSNDGLPAIPFAAEISRHHADDERSATSKHNPRIIAYTFEFAGFVRNAKVLGQFPRDIAFLMNAE